MIPPIAYRPQKTHVGHNFIYTDLYCTLIYTAQPYQMMHLQEYHQGADLSSCLSISAAKFVHFCELFVNNE